MRCTLLKAARYGMHILALYATACCIAAVLGGTASLVLFTGRSGATAVVLGAAGLVMLDESDSNGLAAQHKLHSRLKASS